MRTTLVRRVWRSTLRPSRDIFLQFLTSKYLISTYIPLMRGGISDERVVAVCRPTLMWSGSKSPDSPLTCMSFDYVPYLFLEGEKRRAYVCIASESIEPIANCDPLTLGSREPGQRQQRHTLLPSARRRSLSAIVAPDVPGEDFVRFSRVGVGSYRDLRSGQQVRFYDGGSCAARKLDRVVDLPTSPARLVR